MTRLVFVLCLVPGICHADCGQFFGYRQAVVVRQVQQVYQPHAVAVKYVAPVAAYTNYHVAQPLYQVGQGLQDQAEREKIAREAVNFYKEGLSDGLKVAGGNGAAQLNQQAKDSVIAQRCGKCHGSASAAPKGGLYFDAGLQYDATTIVKTLRILSGEGVPEGMKSTIAALSAEDKGKIMSELLTSEKK